MLSTNNKSKLSRRNHLALVLLLVVSVPLLCYFGYFMWSAFCLSLPMDPVTREAFKRLPPETRKQLSSDACQTRSLLKLARLGFQITGFTQGERPSFLYRIDFGSAELEGCTFVEDGSGTRTGKCTTLIHDLPPFAGEGSSAKVQHDIELDVNLSWNPVARTPIRGELSFGKAGQIRLAGAVQVDRRDVVVHDAELQVPNPAFENMDSMDIALPVGDVSIRHTTTLKGSREASLGLPMPAGLGGGLLTEMRGRLEVKVRSGDLIYLLAGKMTFLGSTVFEGRIDYYPKNYISVSFDTDHVLLTWLVPGRCFDLENVLLEYDMREHRLRIAGTVPVGLTDLFGCFQAEVDEVSEVPPALFTKVLEEGFETTSLSKSIPATGHLVYDSDDSFFCVQLNVGGRSFLRFKYSTAEGKYEMWAPKSFKGREGNRFRERFERAPSSFPRESPWKCWPDDPGPKTDLFASVFPD